MSAGIVPADSPWNGATTYRFFTQPVDSILRTAIGSDKVGGFAIGSELVGGMAIGDNIIFKR